MAPSQGSTGGKVHGDTCAGWVGVRGHAGCQGQFDRWDRMGQHGTAKIRYGRFETDWEWVEDNWIGWTSTHTHTTYHWTCQNLQVAGFGGKYSATHSVWLADQPLFGRQLYTRCLIFLISNCSCIWFPIWFGSFRTSTVGCYAWHFFAFYVLMNRFCFPWGSVIYNYIIIYIYISLSLSLARPRHPPAAMAQRLVGRRHVPWDRECQHLLLRCCDGQWCPSYGRSELILTAIDCNWWARQRMLSLMVRPCRANTNRSDLDFLTYPCNWFLFLRCDHDSRILANSGIDSKDMCKQTLSSQCCNCLYINVVG